MGCVARYHELLTLSSNPRVRRFAHREKPGSLDVVYTAWCISRMHVKGVTAMWVFMSLLQRTRSSRDLNTGDEKEGPSMRHQRILARWLIVGTLSLLGLASVRRPSRAPDRFSPTR